MDKTIPSSSSSSSSMLSTVEQQSEPIKYRGVRKRKWGKYVSEIRLPNRRDKIWLGSYTTAEKAARAFDAALFILRGPESNFNFPSNPPNIDRAGPLTAQEIQEVAQQYAMMANDEVNNDHNQQSQGSGPTTGSEDYMDPSYWDMQQTDPFMNPESGYGFGFLEPDYINPHFTLIQGDQADDDSDEQISKLWNFDQTQNK